MMKPYRNSINAVLAKNMIEAGIDIKLMIRFIHLTLDKTYGLASCEQEILEREQMEIF